MDEDEPAEPSWMPTGRGMLRDQAYAQLRRALLCGHIAPGRSVSVRSLAELVGVGIMPTRDAVHRLTVEGALEHMANGRVRAPLVTRVEFDELIALRLLLEPYACARACEVGPPVDLGATASALMERRGGETLIDMEEALWANYRLHFTVYGASGSRHLVELIDNVWLRYGPLLNAPMSDEPTAMAYRVEVGRLEPRLIDAVVGRDADYAASLMRRIIQRTADWYAANFTFRG